MIYQFLLDQTCLDWELDWELLEFLTQALKTSFHIFPFLKGLPLHQLSFFPRLQHGHLVWRPRQRLCPHASVDLPGAARWWRCHWCPMQSSGEPGQSWRSGWWIFFQKMLKSSQLLENRRDVWNHQSLKNWKVGDQMLAKKWVYLYIKLFNGAAKNNNKKTTLSKTNNCWGEV